MTNICHFGKFKADGFGVDLRRKNKTVNEKVQKSRTRDKKGCFCCRKRKIKCTLQKPTCFNCEKAGYLCVWPEKEKSLSRNSEFILRKVDNQRNLTLAKSNDHAESETIHDALFRKVLIEINKEAISGKNFNMPLFCFVSEENSSLFDAFISGFMTIISPQFAHFKLQPGSAFIPSGTNNKIVQNLFGACGASFLYVATKNNDMKLLAQFKFNKSVSELFDYTLERGVAGNESWIIIFFLLSYLKLRFVYDGAKLQTLSMLTIIEAIKLWVIRKQKQDTFKMLIEKKVEEIDDVPIIDDNPNIKLLKCDTEKESEHIFKDITNNLKILVSETGEMDYSSSEDSKNKYSRITNTNINFLFCGNACETGNYNLLPFERTMLESFVYNYSNSLLICDRSLLKEITPPDVIFDMLRPYLLGPIYKCAVPWMNHPVVGAALPLLELQAKSCWIGLSKNINNENKNDLIAIINTVKYYMRPILPLNVKMNEPKKVQEKLLESCYVAEILSKAIFVYCSKLLNPNLDINDLSIQNAVEQAYQAFQNISVHSQVHMSLTFSIVVIGCSSVKQKHQAYFSNKLKHLKIVFKVYALTSIEKLLVKAWEEDSKGKSKGWNVLYDYNYLKDLVI